MSAAAGADPESTDVPDIDLLSVPEVAEALGVRDRDVRSLLSDRSLVAVRRTGGGPAVPAAFLVTADDGTTVVLHGLRGTLTQLADAGFSDDEAIAWLFRDNDELGSTPVAALAALRTHAVRRSAQALAF